MVGRSDPSKSHRPHFPTTPLTPHTTFWMLRNGILRLMKGNYVHVETVKLRLAMGRCRWAWNKENGWGGEVALEGRPFTISSLLSIRIDKIILNTEHCIYLRFFFFEDYKGASRRKLISPYPAPQALIVHSNWMRWVLTQKIFLVFLRRGQLPWGDWVVMEGTAIHMAFVDLDCISVCVLISIRSSNFVCDIPHFFYTG